MTQIQFPLHSVIVLAGPIGSGKTYLAQNIIYFHLYSQRAGFQRDGKSLYPWHTVHVLSLEECQREIVGNPDAKKYWQAMNLARGQAKNLLFSKMQSFMKWPYPADAIILDDCDFDKYYLDEIKEECDKNNYHFEIISLNFGDDIENYFLDSDEFMELYEENKDGILKRFSSGLDEMKNEYLSTPRTIRSKQELKEINWSFCNADQMNKCYLDRDNSIHIFREEFNDQALDILIEAKVYQPEDSIVVFGKHNVKTTAGNLFVLATNEFETDCLPFVYCEGLIISNAMCESQYLGKLSDRARIAQRTAQPFLLDYPDEQWPVHLYRTSVHGIRTMDKDYKFIPKRELLNP